MIVVEERIDMDTISPPVNGNMSIAIPTSSITVAQGKDGFFGIYHSSILFGKRINNSKKTMDQTHLSIRILNGVVNIQEHDLVIYF